ncbi:MAG TPA: enoyl-CoA hydratase-related protein [Bauldia sp.]|nr:enoyl-CoA hydratase-related protein [Bauldia sp.]
MSQHVFVDASGGVQTIRFDRPETNNTITSEMYEAAADAISNGERDSRIRVFLIAGMPGVFTAGHDFTELGEFARDGNFGKAPIRFLKTIATVEKPMIAAVDGLAVGIGTTLLLHCDYVVASEWSVFSAPFVDLGLAPEAGSSLLAPLLIGYHRAFEMIVMGEHFDAQRAFQAGIVNRVVPAEQVEEAGREAARALAAKPPEAVRLARRLLRGDSRALLQRIDVEVTGFGELRRSPAAQDALQAYLDRKP